MLSTLSWRIESLLANPDWLSRLRAEDKAAARPCASFDIVDIMATRLHATPRKGLPALSAPQAARRGRASRR